MRDIFIYKSDINKILFMKATIYLKRRDDFL